ncbi:TonB-dependent receptor plug domain-containing protein [Acetobacter persici]|uniref:TonB-dependent receptor plug domain-containing protein n=1 Tax=Acetobacter persici TaxID=1076596 RepID=UPI0036DEEE58
MFVRRVNFLLVSTSLSVLWSAGAYADPVKATSKARSSALLQQPGASRHFPFKVRKKRPAGDDEVVIVTGTRESNRKARNSIAPIDVITARQLQQTGETDPSRALTRVMPSISMSSYGNDTSAFNSTIRMRGLNPNEVLILVDGQRRHQTSLMSYDTGPEQGATPTDIDTIPASMIDHIEVLRDGAAAQYGSDAIAGVVNIILKKDSHKGSAYSQIGQTEEGDGFAVTAGFDKGFSWGKDGFVHLSYDYKHQDHTVRSGPDNRTGQYDNKVLGQPELTRHSFGTTFGKNIVDDRLVFFGNATYAHKHGESYQNYRLPTSLPAVYPNGYTPIQTDNENDYSVTVGFKGTKLLGFDWKISSTWGEDIADISNKDTANLAYYADYGTTPTNFDVAGYRSTQWTNNFDLRRSVDVGLAMPIVFAGGAEYRYEKYDISAGSPASYYKSGSQGLGGIIPAIAGGHSRDVTAGYIDVDIHPIKQLDIDLAGRTEHYTDVGDTQTGKIAARYDLSRRIAFRAAISSGFRAPTLAEEYFSNIVTDATGGASGLLATGSTGAQLIGASKLKPERSTNASGGIVLEPIDHWHIAADVYQINIRDRIVGGGRVNGEQAIEAIEANGIPLQTATPSDVTANYLTNDASTRTQGLDITSDYTLRTQKYGTFQFNLALNLNRTTIHHMALNASGGPQLNAQLATYLTNATPKSKIILGMNWNFGKFDLMLRETRFGSLAENLTFYAAGPNQYSTSVFQHFINAPRWNTDIELGYKPLTYLRVAVGARNVTNIKPSKLPAANSYVGSYWYSIRNGQMGFNGGFYYARANLSF